MKSGSKFQIGLGALASILAVAFMVSIWAGFFDGFDPVTPLLTQTNRISNLTTLEITDETLADVDSSSPRDLYNVGPVQVTVSVKAGEAFLVPCAFYTNNGKISVKNQGSAPVQFNLYSGKTRGDTVICTTTISGFSTDTAEGLTSAQWYWIEVTAESDMTLKLLIS